MNHTGKLQRKEIYNAVNELLKPNKLYLKWLFHEQKAFHLLTKASCYFHLSLSFEASCRPLHLLLRFN